MEEWWRTVGERWNEEEDAAFCLARLSLTTARTQSPPQAYTHRQHHHTIVWGALVRSRVSVWSHLTPRPPPPLAMINAASFARAPAPHYRLVQSFDRDEEGPLTCRAACRLAGEQGGQAGGEQGGQGSQQRPALFSMSHPFLHASLTTPSLSLPNHTLPPHTGTRDHERGS